jgi:beta-glucanase (GH16 family)
MSYTPFLYGQIEARVLIPYGQGFWPAFWLLHDYDENNSNEVDIMESVNTDHTDYLSDHYTYRGRFSHATSQVAITGGWHTLGLYWSKTKLQWLVDGKAVFTITDSKKIPQTSMYIILNFAIGGDWPGPPNATTVFPAHFLIDYLRIR